jgi:uncharacterized membrane protein YfcA
MKTTCKIVIALVFLFHPGISAATSLNIVFTLLTIGTVLTVVSGLVKGKTVDALVSGVIMGAFISALVFQPWFSDTTLLAINLGMVIATSFAPKPTKRSTSYVRSTDTVEADDILSGPRR